MWWARAERKNNRAERSDPDKLWYPQREVDYAEMEREAAEGRYGERHQTLQYHDGTFPNDLSEWSEKRTDAHPYHYMAGVTVYVAPERRRPHDHFLGGFEVCEECSGVAEHVADDEGGTGDQQGAGEE